MWIFSTIGFFSVTQVREKPEVLQVRARVRDDLDNLRKLYLPTLTETVKIPHRDYPYRGYTDREQMAEAMGKIFKDLCYSNFKSEVQKKQGLAREQLYHDVWHVMYDAERKLAEKERRYGRSRGSDFLSFDDYWERFRSSTDDDLGHSYAPHTPPSRKEFDAPFPENWPPKSETETKKPTRGHGLTREHEDANEFLREQHKKATKSPSKVPRGRTRGRTR